MPVAGAGGPPGSPPVVGAGGATMSTQNRGLQAAAIAQLTHAIRIMEKALPMLGVETEMGKDVMSSLSKLSKHIAPGGGSPGVEQSALQQMMMQHKQDQPMLQALRAQGQGQPGGGGGAPPPMPPPAQAA